jgi:hypothetical protein
MTTAFIILKTIWTILCLLVAIFIFTTDAQADILGTQGPSKISLFVISLCLAAAACVWFI